MIRIAINGMGRIGRNVFRIIEKKFLKSGNIIVVAINEASSTLDHLIYQLKNDSIHGKDSFVYQIKNNNIILNQHEIKRFSTRNIEEIDWGKYNVDVVIDATGKFLTTIECQQHIKNGAKKVIISAPPKDNTPIFVIGVNESKYDNQQIISNGSCTTNCLAPFLKILDENFLIKDAMMCTVHATTSSQSLLDSKNKKNWRLGRCSNLNIIPSTTGATKVIDKIIPNLKGKILGMAYRVPVMNGSVVDLNVRLGKELNINHLLDLINKSSVISLAPTGCVSCDIIDNSSSCILDDDLILKQNNFYKFVLWYDNEFGYSNRLVELAQYIG